MSLAEQIRLESRPGLKVYAVFIQGLRVGQVKATSWKDAMDKATAQHGNYWVEVTTAKA